MDEGLRAVNIRVDSIRNRMMVQDSVRAIREAETDLDLDFIIRLGCRTMKDDAELMLSCRRRGAIR
jgi:hypothetical protein